MPELPEVETVKRTLSSCIIGRQIKKVELEYVGNIRQPDPDSFCKNILGKIFEDIDRRGKFLIFYLSEDLALIVHLRMTGQLVCVESLAPVEKHTHLIFKLDNGMDLRYLDLRKFGTFDLLSREELKFHKSLVRLGLEPLAPEFTLENFKKKLSGRSKNMKMILLDQEIFAGIGNIYADEILFDAGIHPNMSPRDLSSTEIERVYKSINQILKLGINFRGTTFSNYVDGTGQEGQFQNFLKVYRRSGKSCYNCDGIITRIKLGGRGTHFCPKCQQKK